MSFSAAAANLAWLTSSAPAAWRYQRALSDPESTQWHLLREQLARNSRSGFGRQHGFEKIRAYSDFTQRVPLARYEDFAPSIARIQRGDPAVLTSEPVTRLLPTSGSSGARKLIPFTASLQREFNAAISPWMSDLCRQHPTIALGCAYWSVTPAARTPDREPSAIAIGFDDDRSYLGGARARLVESAMAAPSALRHASDMEQFRYLALLCLLRRPDLRLVSVWHPSFFALLLDALPKFWDALLNDLAFGTCSRGGDALPPALRAALSGRPRPARAAELKLIPPTAIARIWPALCVVSCWDAGHAAPAVADLQQRVPNVVIQPKGLLATEAFVTLPFRGLHPLAIRSHFFEFIAADQKILRAHELREGETYEVVVTTGGGLWRYRLGDRVEVNGWMKRTPSLRFLGRTGNLSDRRGEKLSEDFVAAAIRASCKSLQRPPLFTLLAPEEVNLSCHYTLFVEGEFSEEIAPRLETQLRQNPHYALCRDLDQLGPVRLSKTASGAYQRFVAAEMRRGARFGDIKPLALSPRSDWSGALC